MKLIRPLNHWRDSFSSRVTQQKCSAMKIGYSYSAAKGSSGCKPLTKRTPRLLATGRSNVRKIVGPRLMAMEIEQEGWMTPRLEADAAGGWWSNNARAPINSSHKNKRHWHLLLLVFLFLVVGRSMATSKTHWFCFFYNTALNWSHSQQHLTLWMLRDQYLSLYKLFH